MVGKVGGAALALGGMLLLSLTACSTAPQEPAAAEDGTAERAAAEARGHGAESAPRSSAAPDQRTDDQGADDQGADQTDRAERTPAPDAAAGAEDSAAGLPEGVRPRPEWLGTRPLPETADGHAPAQPTPEELVDRRLPPPEPPPGLPAPPGDGSFRATIDAVPAAVAARATWQEDCPVALEDLRYLTLTFWGFDERAHTGELVVHRRAAEAIAGVFERLYAARFPIEELRVVAPEELDAPPTGDGNNTTGFVCRDVAGPSASWSEHAKGLAVDVNPFHNPYVRGDLVLPELATAYLERDVRRPGMIQPDDVVTEAFAEIGWSWGGNWRSSKDWMHFSASGR